MIDRLVFACSPEERHLPMMQRKRIVVFDRQEAVAYISCADDGNSEASQDRSHQTAIWKAKLLHKHFDPFSYAQEKSEKEPYIDHGEGGLSLVNPNKMTMQQARVWVRDNVR